MADDLNTAIASWVSDIAGKIDNDPNRGAALSIGLPMPGAELSVTANLRARLSPLESVHAGRRVELHREAIPPLRLGVPISTPIDR